MVKPEIDADTFDGCRRGDSAAQRRVFDRYKDRVFSIALTFLKGDSAGAQDIAQEVFVKVFRAAATFRQDARLSTWIYRITANACMDEMRRRRRTVLFGTMPSQLEKPVDPDEPAEMDAELHAALSRLSPKLRIAVLLRYFDDLSYEEIAEALGVTTGTVASRLNRAHKFLARQLAPRRERVSAGGDR